MIHEIDINKFRGINSLRLEQLGRVNVLLGNNNAGKSTALEAIILLLGSKKPTLALEINNNRSYNFVGKDDFALFFYKLNTQNKIKLSATFLNGEKKETEISYFESVVNSLPIPSEENGSLDLQEKLCYGLILNNTEGERKYQSKLIVRTDKQSIESEVNEKSSENKFIAAYIAPRYNFEDFISNFNKIVTDKEKDIVLEVLRHVEPTIQDIAVVGKVVMVDSGLNRLIPINMMGDGIRKLFTILTAMYSVRGGVLLIDEVDNGLYYNSVKTLWSSLIKAARSLDVQLIVSTHNIDSLNALNDFLSDEENKVYREDTIIYSLRHKNDGNVIALRYPYVQFNHILNMEVEIR